MEQSDTIREFHLRVAPQHMRQYLDVLLRCYARTSEMQFGPMDAPILPGTADSLRRVFVDEWRRSAAIDPNYRVTDDELARYTEFYVWGIVHEATAPD